LTKNDNLIIENALVGRITKIYGTTYVVEVSENNDKNELFLCNIKGEYRKLQGIKDKESHLRKEKSKIFKLDNTRNPITVGDFVRFVPVNDKPINNEKIQGTIYEVLPRKNKLSRSYDTPTFQTEGKQNRFDRKDLIKEQLIASNIDYVLCVNSVRDPEFKTGLIDRVLISAEKEEIEPIIIINKIDLDENKIKEKFIKEIYEPIGYKIFFVSAKNNIRIEELKSFITDKTIILTGHSGVGKSSIVNAILGEDKLTVSETSTYHHKGKHTTTNSELIRTLTGGYLIDTPGVKLFGIYDVDEDDIHNYYREFQPYIGNCKYRHCRHINEPDCAVKEAVEKGFIHEERYKNYVNISQRVSSKY